MPHSGPQTAKPRFLFNALASGFFISYLPTRLLKNRKCTGAGLLGSLEALLLVPLLPANPIHLAVFLLAFTAFAIWVAANSSFTQGPAHDNPRIVIDEIIGYWWACAFLPRTLTALLSAFVLFRFLDTVKPFYIDRLDKMPGAAGVVLDDVASGIASNLLVRAGMLCAAYL
ncbi:MAG TPA: phosphatidylglycerophosphatase A [Elusimicrobiales bacterium]|nr:phosphatidylglycerophosphatase A [Elusimicrobiales bacterium]